VSTLAVVCATLVVAMAGAAVARADDFAVDPSTPLTGHEVTFTYAGPGQAETWDLDGDGAYDDASGSTAVRTYRVPGAVDVGLEVTDGSDVHTYTRTVTITGPSPAFVSYPAAPVVGEQVTFVYSSTSEPVDAGSIGWDLNGDGAYDDAEGPTAFRAFVVPGTYPVGVRVPSNVDDAVSTGTQFITVKPLPQAGGLGGPVIRPGLMTPFPIVRITGRVTRRGSRIKRLLVTAPNGASVLVTCRGRGCPYRRSRHTVVISGRHPKPAKTVRFTKLRRHVLRGGTVLKVMVSRSHEIGKYTRFLVRKGRPPLRKDLCLPPGTTKPTACPSS
jgi:hypothetical protein